MKFSSNHTYFILTLLLIIIILLFSLINNQQTINPKKAYAASPIQHVFIILMENHDWRDIKGNSQAPYINSLLSQWSHAEQYYNPPGTHPSAPNYVWLEAGTAVAGSGDCKPTDSGCSSSANHLSKQLDAVAISWREYAEDASGTNCILDFSSVDVNHVGFSYFTDVTNNNNPNSANCINHERPFTQLATDLQNNTIARYNFITPNLNDDMHNGTIQQGDTWLSQQVPSIMNSQAYKNGGVIFITWDEGEGDDGPIGMIVVSPFAKKNYTNSIHYDHGSTLKTLEEIFGVSPFLGNAATATDLSDFFTVPLIGTVGTTPAPTNITPTLFCLGSGSCVPTISPTNSAPGVTITGTTTATPSQNPCVTTASKGSVHAFKERTRTNGAISTLILLLLQFLLQLLQQLFGSGNVVVPPTNPNPTINPSLGPSVNPTLAPTINPCVTPTS